MNKPDMHRVLNAIRSEQWLITDEWYDRIVEIASRENTLTPEMISTFQGKQSGRGHMASMYGDTAVLNVQGPVFRYANLFTMLSGATSTEVLSSELGRLKADTKVSRVIMRFDTPGGVASGAAEMSTQIQNFGKPLVSFATGLCASLGYFWASQGDQVIVAEDAIVGNIGTRTQAPGKASEKDMVSKNAPRKILDRGAVLDVINSLESVFIQHVATGRSVSVEHVAANFGQGGVFVGQNAVNAGLADSVGTLDSILGGSFANYRPTKTTHIGNATRMKSNLQIEQEEQAEQAQFAASWKKAVSSTSADKPRYLSGSDPEDKEAEDGWAIAIKEAYAEQ